MPIRFFRMVLCLLSMMPPILAQAQDEPLPDLKTAYVFTIEAGISAAIPMGETVDGSRQSIPITGGIFYGDGIKGEIIPGGADYQQQRSDGSTAITAVYMLRTDDGALINVVNEGLILPPGSAGNAELYFRTSPKFTAPNGKYGWLNHQIFVCGVRFSPAKPNTVILDIYKLL